MTATAPTPSSPATAAKWFKILHFALLTFIFGSAMYVWRISNVDTGISYLLATLSLILISFGVIFNTSCGQRAVLTASLLVGAVGAILFVCSLQSAAASGPRVNDITFDFRAVGYKVEAISGQPCTPQDTNNVRRYTCDVTVTPLKSETAPAAAGAPAVPATEQKVSQ